MTVADLKRQPRSNLHAFWSPHRSEARARQGENSIRLAVPQWQRHGALYSFQSRANSGAAVGLCRPICPSRLAPSQRVSAWVPVSTARDGETCPLETPLIDDKLVADDPASRRLSCRPPRSVGTTRRSNGNVPQSLVERTARGDGSCCVTARMPPRNAPIPSEPRLRKPKASFVVCFRPQNQPRPWTSCRLLPHRWPHSLRVWFKCDQKNADKEVVLPGAGVCLCESPTDRGQRFVGEPRLVASIGTCQCFNIREP
jgi:hypothetical protein